jgi:hypothetical protein
MTAVATYKSETSETHSFTPPMASTSADGPVSLPPFPPDNTIELVSVKDSKIISVSVYSGRAEITRLFKFSVKSGLNQVVVLGLPSALDRDSFRQAFLPKFWLPMCCNWFEQSRGSRHSDNP